MGCFTKESISVSKGEGNMADWVWCDYSCLEIALFSVHRYHLHVLLQQVFFLESRVHWKDNTLVSFGSSNKVLWSISSGHLHFLLLQEKRRKTKTFSDTSHVQVPDTKPRIDSVGKSKPWFLPMQLSRRKLLWCILQTTAFVLLHWVSSSTQLLNTKLRCRPASPISYLLLEWKGKWIWVKRRKVLSSRKIRSFSITGEKWSCKTYWQEFNWSEKLVQDCQLNCTF